VSIFSLRDYSAVDERSWLRCRALSFLATAYFDDVRTAKPTVDGAGLELVAVDDDGAVVGIMDVSVDGDLATIDTVAVHPDHQHRGIGRALLAEARARTPGLGVTVLDAWTRDDEDTLRWYRAMGFQESEHYLHVYANHYTRPDEPDRAIGTRRDGLTPIAVFLHATLEDEEWLRKEFTRVHVCRRFALRL
jgi:ribosomal protein S18 acetylase RimI-like enzyme